MTKYYAGIGSRETPRDIQEKMTEIAKRLSRSNYCLRSGGAHGADNAFEEGADHKQIFLPWDRFNDRVADEISYIVPPYAEDYIFQYHPRPQALSASAKKFMSRNTYQVLGPDLNDPVEFVLCWTRDGKASGGTGQAVRIANAYKVPVFNLKNGFQEFSSYMTNISFFG